MKKILYIGKVDKFTLALVQAITPLKSKLQILNLSPDLPIRSLLQQILAALPDVIIWSYDPANVLKFNRIMNFISHEEKTRKVAKILVCFEQHMDELRKLSCISNIVYFVRGIEVDDITYYLKCLLLPDDSTSEQAARAFFHNKINLFESLKVRSIGRDFAEIESNRGWENGSEINLELPGTSEVHVSRTQTLEQRIDSDIQSGFRFHYKIYYKFDVLKFKPDYRHTILEEMRYKLSSEIIDETVFKSVLDIDKRSKTISLVTKKAEVPQDEDPRKSILKSLENCCRSLLLNSIYKNFNIEKYYFNTISIYDHQLSTIDSSYDNLDKLGTIINWRMGVLDAAAEIRKDKPSVIVINYSSVNGFEQVKQVAAATTQFRDYFPFILLFNFHEADIDAYRHTVQYHYIIGTTIPINENLISKLITTYRTKRMSKEQPKAAANLKELMSFTPYFQGTENVFLDLKNFYHPTDTAGIVETKHPIEIIWMSEFEIVFFSKSFLTSGEIYSIEIPIRFNIVIVPHIPESRESSIKDCYRGLIHFIKENDKQAVRRFINHVLDLSETRKSSIKEDEIKEIKRQYFGEEN
jgi:hypothetical protein